VTFATVPIGSIFSVRNGATPSSREAANWDGDIPWVGPADLGQLSGRYVEHGSRSITRHGYESCGTHMVPAGSIILSTRAPIGHTAIASQALCFNQGCRGLVPSSRIDGDFAYWAVLEAKPRLQAAGQGTTFVELPRSKLRATKLPLPDLLTQKAIAAFLDRETTRIDQLIEKKQRLVELLEERKFAKTTEVLTGATTPAAVRRKAGPEWMPSVPDGWRWVRMKNICTRIIDCKNRTPPSFDRSDYFVVRTTCVRNGSFNPSGGYWTDRASYLEWTQRGESMEGDVIFTREAPVGEACLAPTGLRFCLGQRTMIYRPDRSKVTPEYIIATIYSSIGRDYIQSKSKGSTVGHLRVGEVYDFPCLLPPLERQRALLAEIRHASGDVDQMTKLTKTSIDRLKEYRSALITAAITGQIDVETWSRRGETDRCLDRIEEEMAE